ncbi:hypothetical protein T458_20225 [Brevibacillus panacihumi W25]|uniref:Uncharacterized protein n=1 Tax=Brevibacillus panacihumi W25 TaxID=1408254 RepID=V6M6G0_9BACL|nr:hypothetical protein T458_20225 [Brevibacillus panacihumi W25]
MEDIKKRTAIRVKTFSFELNSQHKVGAESQWFPYPIFYTCSTNRINNKVFDVKDIIVK